VEARTTQRNGAPSRALLATVFGLALVLRLVHVASIATYEQTNVLRGLDRWLDMEIAQAVASGDLLGGPLAPYDSAPAYALLLGLLERASGGSWLGPLLVQAFLGASVSLLLYGAGRRLASPRVGLFAAVLAAIYAPAIFYEGLTVKFGLVPVAVSAFLYTLAATVTAARPHAAAIAAGVATATLVALRPNAIVLLPVALLWIAWAREPRVAARAILLLGAGLVIVAAPLAARRTLAAARGDAASLWGIHFYIGTIPEGDGGYVTVPGVADDIFGHVDDAREVAEAARGRELTPGEVSRYWFDQGVELIRGDPWAYLRLLARKLQRALAPGEANDFGDEYADYAAHSSALHAGIGFATLAPLAAFGLAIAARQHRMLLWAAALAAVYALSLLIFFVTARYRLPIVPPLLLLAGAALAWIGGAVRESRWPAVGAMTVLCLGASLALGASASEAGRALLVFGLAAALSRNDAP
jgi:hypothetical protein